TVNDSKHIVPFKIAALIGIIRHVSLGISDPKIQDQVLAMAMNLAGGAAQADDVSDAGAQWMRKQAIELLGLLGSTGKDNQVVKLLSAAIGDAKAPFFTRCTAAEALRKLKFSAAGVANAVALAKPIGQMMLDACQKELKIAAEKQAPLSRRRLKTVLGAAEEGLKGVRPLAKDSAQQAKLKELDGILDDLLKVLDKDTSQDAGPASFNERDGNNELQEAVVDCARKLKDWLD
ncbi:MAG: hypothetical protein ACWGMZ_05470, partial [Thermoguttaceae bacterium]